MRKHRPNRNRLRRIEAEYKRNGALQYFAAWDVHRGIVLGQCEKKTGIKPFGLLVDQVLEQDPYKDATQLFFIVNNGSSHRGQASVERMHRRDKRIVLVHTPIHASWLNQVEIYFSIIQRKVLTSRKKAREGRIVISLKPFRWNPAGNQSRPVEPDQQPEASLLRGGWVTTPAKRRQPDQTLCD